ncbi:hypothetical protein Tco_0122563 [Tanacetum coccineum]
MGFHSYRRPWISSIGYNGDIGAIGTLKKSRLPPRIIWEDIIHKLNKKTRQKIVPYPRFISLLLEYMMHGYDHEDLTINPTQVFSAYNWALKANQHEGPPFTDHMKAICNIDVPTEASKSKTGQSDKETQSSLAKDKSPSHPSPSTPVVGEMHKEAQKAGGGPTSLGTTSEEGAYPQLSNGCDALENSTVEAEPRISAPNTSYLNNRLWMKEPKTIYLITYLKGLIQVL